MKFVALTQVCGKKREESDHIYINVDSIDMVRRDHCRPVVNPSEITEIWVNGSRLLVWEKPSEVLKAMARSSSLTGFEVDAEEDEVVPEDYVGRSYERRL